MRIQSELKITSVVATSKLFGFGSFGLWMVGLQKLSADVSSNLLEEFKQAIILSSFLFVEWWKCLSSGLWGINRNNPTKITATCEVIVESGQINVIVNGGNDRQVPQSKSYSLMHQWVWIPQQKYFFHQIISSFGSVFWQLLLLNMGQVVTIFLLLVMVLEDPFARFKS